MSKAIMLAVLAFLAAVQGHLTRQGKWEMRGVSSPRVYHLPPQDNMLLAEQEDGSHGGYQFAHPVPFPIYSTQDGFWDILPGGAKVWSFTVSSEGALNLGLTFEEFYLPEGSELHVSGEKETRGAFTASNNPTDGHFTLFPFEGSTLTVEYYQPHWVDEEPSLKVYYVAHGYKTLGFGDSGSCNINVACDSGKWSNQIRSSGMLLSSFGSRFCSGALVNNAENDGTQYFLTAAHCSVGSSDQVMFNYQSPTCTPNQNGPTNSIVGKLTRLASNTYSDFTLLLIGDQIPSAWNVYLSGISAENVAPQSMHGIHHPSGDIKKISHANKAGTPTKWFSNEPGNWHWRVSSWDEGTTEPGSSGSPLYDQNQRVVGQLHGGAASCRNNDYDSYGAVWASWSNGMQTYLDPKNSGRLVIDGANLNEARVSNLIPS